MSDTPKVFISYSHDGAAHEERVLALADRLCKCGVDAEIDQYHDFPEERWPAWCKARIEEADHVLVVCTETYRRRFDGKEDEGQGLGVCWEAPIIQQLLYDAGGKGRKMVPVLLADAMPEHIPTEIRGFARFIADTEDGFERLCRFLLNKPRTPKPTLGEPPDLPPAPRPGLAGGPISPIRKTASPVPAPGPTSVVLRAARLFVGRVGELAALAAMLRSAEPRPVVVFGMAGVGKSYLVDRFAADHRADYPGGYVRVALDPVAPGTVEDALAQIAAALCPPLADQAAVPARLASPPTLLHVENVDTPEASSVAGGLEERLPGCAIVFSARFAALAAGTGWGGVRLDPFDPALALDQLECELKEMATPPARDTLEPVARHLGGLPLALHLAAGWLRTGETPQSFLRMLARKDLDVAPANPAAPAFKERKRMSASFLLSLDALEREGGEAGAAWRAGFEALGWGAAAGFGQSLGASIAGLDADAFEDMTRAAARLSLLDRRTREDGFTFRLHPLLAELGRARAPREETIARITGWFCERLPEPGEGEPWRWNEVHAETPSLLDWLVQVPAAERLRVVRAGMWMAINTGPFHAWRRFCERALEDAGDDAERSDVLWTLGQVALKGGDPDAAIDYARQQLEVDRRRGAERDAALAAGLIADILRDRGQLDEVLRIHREEQLPVYERLGDVRERAVTMGQIADILSARGQLDEALRILREELLPAFERLGDVRSRAVTMGKIADILEARGQLAEALRIRREEELPVYERLGDVRSRAVTMGQIADILSARGQLDEAIAIRRDEVLPALQKVGDVREVLVGRAMAAQLLLVRNNVDDREQANRLLCLALEDARRLRIPEAEQIEAILAEHGLSCG